MELKELVATGKPANRELACDLASLALRSGLLVVGIRERAKNVAGEVVGVPLTGYRDRIDQVARDKIHPPLYVDIREIEDPDRTGHGCLLVAVPATGPHMADERYWGRGDTGKRALTDAEVRQYLARKRTDREAVLEQVRELEQAYPRPDEGPPTPKLFVRAVSVSARPGCLRELIEDANGERCLHDLAQQVKQRRPDQGWTTPIQSGHFWMPHNRGRVLCDRHPDQEATSDPRLQMVFDEDGAISLMSAGIHDRRPRNGAIPFPQSDGPGPTNIATRILLHTVTDLLGVAGLLAHGTAAYQGEWLIAVRIPDLGGCYDNEQFQDFRVATPAAFQGGSAYEEATAATTTQLVDEPWVVTEQLLARLVRALGASHRYLPYTPQAPTA